jgi:hypothetical protein
MQLDRLADLVADGEDRIERGHRLLKDHRDLVAADFAHLLVVELQEIAPAIDNFTADDFSRRRLNEAHDRQRSHALAATRLTDQTESFALADLEAHAVDGAHFALGGKKRCLQIFNLE